MQRRSFFQGLTAILAVASFGGLAITPTAEAALFGIFGGIARRRRRRYRRRHRRRRI